jgi:hypothetical protein
MTLSRPIFFALVLVTLSAADAHGQSRRGDGRAFAAEAAGGAIGSAAGAVVGLVISRQSSCGVEDLACTIKSLGVAGVGSFVGAAAGALLAGRAADSNPSLIGAVLGSAVGVVAGVAVVHGLTEEVNLRLEKPLTVAVYSITHGIVTAIGSRLVASIR